MSDSLQIGQDWIVEVEVPPGWTWNTYSVKRNGAVVSGPTSAPSLTKGMGVLTISMAAASLGDRYTIIANYDDADGNTDRDTPVMRGRVEYDANGYTAGEAALNTGQGDIFNQASGIETKVDTLLTRIPAALFAGVTSVAAWLGALAGKTADATTLAEIQATTAGATYDNKTDSLAANKDAATADVAAAVWNFGKRTLNVLGSLRVSVTSAEGVRLTAANVTYISDQFYLGPAEIESASTSLNLDNPLNLINAIDLTKTIIKDEDDSQPSFLLRVTAKTTTGASAPVFVFQREVIDESQTNPDLRDQVFFSNVCSPNDWQELPINKPGDEDVLLYRSNQVDIFTRSLEEANLVWSEIKSDVQKLISHHKYVLGEIADGETVTEEIR